MDENARLRMIFCMINEMLLDHAQAPIAELPFTREEIMDNRAAYIGRQSDRLQSIIAAYFEQQTAMMQGLMKDKRFWRFPLPRKRIPIWLRSQLRLKLWKAIRS